MISRLKARMIVFTFAISFFASVDLYATQEKPLYQDPNFFRITQKDIASMKKVRSFAQDRDGFIWFGSRSGVTRYDGLETVHYQHNAEDPFSLSESDTKTITTDQNGNLWVSTVYGLNVFNNKTQNFKRYLNDKDNPDSLIDNIVFLSLDNGDGKIWVGTGKGLDLLDLATEKFTHFEVDEGTPALEVRSILKLENGDVYVGDQFGGLGLVNLEQRTIVRYPLFKDETSFRRINVRSSIVDRRGNIWVGNTEGLFQFSPENGSYKRYLENITDIFNMTLDYQGNIWIGSKNGLHVLDANLINHRSFNYDSMDKASIQNNNTWAVFSDKNNNIWIGHHPSGVTFLNGNPLPIKSFIHHPLNKNSVGPGNVSGIFEDSNGLIWVGTESGLNSYNDRLNIFKRISTKSGSDESTLTTVSAIEEDERGDLWLGSTAGAINHYDKANNVFTKLSVAAPRAQYTPYRGEAPKVQQEPNALSSLNISTIYNDRKNNLWVGNIDSGIDLYIPEHNYFKQYSVDLNDPNSLSHDWIMALYEDSKSNFWVATLHSLDLMDRENGSFSHYRRTGHESGSIEGRITAITEDSEFRLLLGTASGELLHLDKETQIFSDVINADRLPRQAIKFITEDKRKRIWMQTSERLMCYDPQLDQLAHYFPAEGIPKSGLINQQQAYLRKNGELLLAGENGFAIVDLERMEPNNYSPPIVFTNFYIYNQLVVPGAEPSPLRQPINYTDQISLKYNQAVFSINFAALGYRDSTQNMYSYILEGAEDNWSLPSNSNTASYRSLPPGKYIFRVRASNNQGIWKANERTLHILITPPPWNSWWAYILYALALACLLYWYYYLLQKKARKRKAYALELERRVQDRTKELQAAMDHAQQAEALAEEANRAKSLFLAKISHEMRTPMTGVMCMSELMTDIGLSKELQKCNDIILASGRDLLVVIDEVLDFSKAQTGDIKVAKKSFYIDDLLFETLKIFRENRSVEKIPLMSLVDPELHLNMYSADSSLIKQILVNIISNAFKFSREGQIIVRAELIKQAENTLIKFSVEDCGIGISPEKQAALFDAFVQADDSTTREYGGIGLGLSICKQLLDLMGGHIGVDSEIENGATFWVEIPVEIIDVEQIQNAEKPYSNLKNITIAIAEENPAYGEILNEYATRNGIHVISATNFNELEDKLLDDIKADLLLCSTSLPKLNREALAHQLSSQSDNKEMPCLFIGNSHAMRKSHRCFDKPLTEKEFIEQLADTFQKIVKTEINSNIDKLEHKKLNVLIAEDNLVVRMIMDTMIRKCNQTAVLAENGLEALEAVRQSDSPFDIIFMDCDMPVMDGLTATSKIREWEAGQQRSRTKIVAVTAHVLEEQEKRCVECGMDHFIPKPMHLDQIKEMLVAIIEQSENCD